MSRALYVVLFLSVFVSVPGFGQQAAGAAGSAFVTKSSERQVQPGRITLDIVVLDKAGKPVTDLEQKDFALIDNKTAVKPLSFQAFGGTAVKSDPPTEIILLFDYVNDEFKNVADERREVGAFLKENDGHLAQPVSIFVLRDTGLQSLRAPSMDGNELAVAVAKMDSPLRNDTNETGANGDMEKYDKSIHAMSSVAAYEKKRAGRKMLLWIGPGWPLLDSPHFQWTTEAMKQFFKQIVNLSTDLREARVNVYSVGIGSFGVQFAGRGEDPDSNKKPSAGPATFVEVSDSSSPATYRAYLKEVKESFQAKGAKLSVKVLSLHNGGRVLGMDSGLKAQIDTCVQDAASFYTLSFDPPRAGHPDEFHDLKVQIDKPGLAAHTSTAYYNEP